MEFRNRLSNKLKTKQSFYIKMANVIALNEHDFSELIKNIELDPLFEKLRSLGVLKRQKHRNSRIASDFLEFDDNIFHQGSGDSDISEFIEKNKDIIPVIKKMGIEKFKNLFLYNENPDIEEISKNCSIPVPIVKRIMGLVNNVFVISEFFHPSKIVTPNIAYTKVAKIEIDKNQLFCAYYITHMAQGGYLVDSEKLKKLKQTLKTEDKQHLEKIISSINLANQRKSVLHNMISLLSDKQKEFFTKGSISELKVFTEKELAEQLEISRSSVCRTLYAKSIVTPQNKEIPIKMLLPSKKSLIKHILRDVLRDNSKHTDTQLKEKLLKEYNISASRRLVCQCRNEIG
ncbi:MAG: hypothetical protein JW871_07475 [Endomicrobiales bacterium]|nr:hypothetical protein [Endomicrobiales bacterium]